MHGAGILLNDKAMAFAVRIVNLYKWLRDDKREHVLSKQLLRSGTSIGANIAESRAAISRADFVSKLYIAAKECRETQYWIELLYKTEYLNEKQYKSKGNTVDPDEIFENYGADTARLFILSDSPPARDFDWSVSSIFGATVSW